MKKLKSKYLNIPSEILLNKQLKADHKIMMAEIIALKQQKGFCWASNNHFAELCGTHPATVSKAITHLKNLGYIKSFVNRKEGNKRNIYVVEEKLKNAFLESMIEPIPLPTYSTNSTHFWLIPMKYSHIPYTQSIVEVIANRLQINTLNFTFINTKNSTAISKSNNIEKNKQAITKDFQEQKIISEQKSRIAEAEPEKIPFIEERENDQHQPFIINPLAPSLHEVIEYFQLNGNTNEASAHQWFNKMEQKQWQSQNGSKIIDWKKYANKKLEDGAVPLTNQNTETDTLLNKIVQAIYDIHSRHCQTVYTKYKPHLENTLKKVMVHYEFESTDELFSLIKEREEHFGTYSIHEIEKILMSNFELLPSDDEQLPF